MRKRSTKKTFPVLFPKQLDDHGSMGVVKIGTNTTEYNACLMVSTMVFEVFMEFKTLNKVNDDESACAQQHHQRSRVLCV